MKSKIVTPFLWLNHNADQVAKFYTSVFKKSKIIDSDTMSARIKIGGEELILFNGGPHFKHTPAFSLFVSCKTQREIDYYYSKLVARGKPSRCGWLVDRFGISWQVIPDILPQLLGDPHPERASRAMNAMLKMKKLNIKKLKQAHRG